MLDRFQSLLELPAWPEALDVVQISSHWDEDEAWRSVRDALDAQLFARVLRGEPITVRRITHLEPPRGASRNVHSGHRTWIAGLVRDLFQLDMPRHGASARYRLRQLIREPNPNAPAPLNDGWNATDDSEWARGFEALWQTPRCIESNSPPVEVPHGPPADRDPRWYLWH